MCGGGGGGGGAGGVATKISSLLAISATQSIWVCEAFTLSCQTNTCKLDLAPLPLVNCQLAVVGH